MGEYEDKLDEDNEKCNENKETFRKKVDELIDRGFINTGVMDDQTIYSASDILNWGGISDIIDPIQKAILSLLVKNSKTFFILCNTQKGKSRIVSLELKKWGQDMTCKVVPFCIVDNDQTLADQSVDGIMSVFNEQKLKIFTLSSNSKTSFNDIKTYIDAYGSDDMDEYPMPLIALLGNERQCEKMVRIINHIHKKVICRSSSLRYSMMWDEADRTYKQLRNKPFIIDGVNMSCHTFTVEKTDALYRLGYVTATDGDLLDEDYPECANAYLYPIDIPIEDQKNYRALHLPEAVTHIVPYTGKHTNNTYASEIIENNQEHFMTPICLTTGENYFRKIIINSNSKTNDMHMFALWCNSKKMYSLVFNGLSGASVKVYKDGGLICTHKTKGKRFNETLFYIYKKHHLHDKPIIIIGRRKVDRGLGFHYCPKNDEEISIDGQLGNLVSKDKEGIVWTDIILGKIEDKASAVQKSGRGAGIIGNSPQYPGSTHYWTDEHTEQLIRRHNTIVDKSNESTHCSVLQAVTNAKSMIPEIKENHCVDLNTFLVYKDEETVRNVCKELGYDFRKKLPDDKGFYKTTLNSRPIIASLLDAINRVHSGYGGVKEKGGRAPRVYYPCYRDINDNKSLHFVIIIRPTTDPNIIDRVKEKYTPIIIPQTGDY